MIELLIAACLVSGCREFPLLYDAREVSLMTCMVSGQTEVARWQASHPEWRVARWRCGFADAGERQA